jgi:hypothetical protein
MLIRPYLADQTFKAGGICDMSLTLENVCNAVALRITTRLLRKLDHPLCDCVRTPRSPNDDIERIQSQRIGGQLLCGF